MHSNGLVRDLLKNRTLYLMILPAVIFFLVFCYLPMAGIIVAFKSYSYTDGIIGSPWIGFDNFKFFFQSGKAFLVTKNTIVYNFIFMIVNNVLELTFAIILFELAGKFFKKLLQSVIFLPYFISWVVAGAIAYNMLNFEFGAINTLLKSLGFSPVNFYNTPDLWPYILVYFSAWKTVGYGTVVYLASIAGIDAEMYEAAKIDGASLLQRIVHITIPSVMPTMIVLLLLKVSQIARGDFGMFYQLIGSNGPLFDKTDVIDTYSFRALLDLQEFGMAAAVGVYQSVLCFLIILITNAAVKKVRNESALF
ncbi:putative aldouronate transport system permease protein [Paenibacillus sp. UNCCL117]|uniref:ABC transporter permease n=1 Tax=unclassified Paenibacillus TaxID=185978 RepID=UPI00088DCABD|nr:MULTISPECIES: ABC transporter permease subunit [unclassified Paenibacillus]SDD50746.1 putative aldouronate transport system permease protein [Paenibacillus sp. cl123]SFW49671.1 putative aldouronate transport system permease protein [Paenibacillus sp. UNCCL117]